MKIKKHKKSQRKKVNINEIKNEIKSKVSELLELPKEIISDTPKVTLISNTDVTVENYKGIIEYSEKVIRINTSSKMIKLTGERLEIKTITDEEIFIGGQLSSIEFLS